MKSIYLYQLALLSGAATIASCGGVNKGKAEQAAMPNVIFIFADDLGIGDLSCYGATKIATPNIDKLAQEGVRFTNAYATSATSTPSRFGMLTGMYPWRQENTGVAPGNSELLIDTAMVTLADVFKSCNYATAAIGKWHLGLGAKGGTDFNGRITPNTQSIGFDYEFVIPATVDRVPCVYVENGRVANLDPSDPITVSYKEKVGNRPTGLENPELVTLKPTQGHNNTIINGIPRIGWMSGGESALWVDEDIADVITNKAKSFIIENQSAPFFLYMGTQDVHVPRIPHARFKGKSGLGDRGDVILQLDWTIGEIMHTLDSLQIADNTLFIFTSDNGPVLDDGYADQAVELLNGHKPMLDYRGGKYSAFEAGTRVPFIVRWSGKVAPVTQLAQFSQVDVYASLAKLLGVEYESGIAPDSRELLQTLLGKEEKGAPFIIQNNVNNTLSIIQDNWKYIEATNAPEIEFYTRMELGNRKTGMLFDLNSDPCEQYNLVEEQPELAEKLAQLLEQEKVRVEKIIN